MTEPVDDPRQVVAGRLWGCDQITGAAGRGEYAHRLSAGRGGPITAANGIWLTPRTHRATHHHIMAAYAAGWMVETGADPARVPALIRTQLAPHGAWHVLDDLARLAEPDEVEAAGLNPGLTLEVAVARLGLVAAA